MKILKASKERTKEDRSALRKTVGDIIENVIENGDAALLEYNHRFDGCDRASLCSGRWISTLLYGAHAGDSGIGSRCKARYSVLPGHKGYEAHPPEDTGRYGYRRY